MDLQAQANQRSSHQLRIDKFMRLAKQDVPPRPIIPDAKVRELRARLILEEALETIEGLGLLACVDGHAFQDDILDIKDIRFVTAKAEPDLVKIADGCADLSVVTVGTLSACGISDMALMEMVDQNNLDKFGPGHSLREDGKLVKPPGHAPPPILNLLLLQQKMGLPPSSLKK